MEYYPREVLGLMTFNNEDVAICSYDGENSNSVEGLALTLVSSLTRELLDDYHRCHAKNPGREPLAREVVKFLQKDRPRKQWQEKRQRLNLKTIR